MSRTGRTLTALAGAAILLVVAAWFDTVVLRDAIGHSATPDASRYTAVLALGSLLVAGSAMGVGVLAWRARSVAVGLTYAIVGGVLAALPWLDRSFAVRGVDDQPPVLPEPLLTAVSWTYWTTSGSLNAFGTIAAAMLLAGVVALVRWQWDRAAANGSIEAGAPAAGSTLT